jgi:hypothetical protein
MLTLLKPHQSIKHKQLYPKQDAQTWWLDLTINSRPAPSPCSSFSIRKLKLPCDQSTHHGAYGGRGGKGLRIGGSDQLHVPTASVTGRENPWYQFKRRLCSAQRQSRQSLYWLSYPDSLFNAQVRDYLIQFAISLIICHHNELHEHVITCQWVWLAVHNWS